ncbi:CHAT domain-containing protein [Trichocoleus sp. DQ-A1]
MRSQIGLRAFITFLATIVSVDLGFPTVDWQFIQNSQVLAQTPAEREAEDDRLLEQGIEQQKKGQFRASLQSGQEALKIYREIADKKGEGAVLNNLGEAYRSLGDYTRAIEFYQQSLAVDRSLGNREGESYVLNNLGIVHHHLGDYAKRGESPQKLSTLPGAEREALAIATLLNTKALIGNSANESAVVQQMSKAKMIHLATHGLLDDFQRSGVPGAIALAPSGQEDGLLTASEILNLKLNAELVVLSACDTGRGKLTGDGVIGLSRSLITAGVPSVIVTLWAIPDNPSALLMTEFYQNLQQNSDKAQALRNAMLTTMKQYPNQPSAWAAYTLIGEAE